MANILLVDDDPVLIKLYKTRLEKDEHQVFTAVDGQEALDSLAKNQMDIIILDLMMPKVNGFKFLEIYQKDEKINNIPVIVFSSLVRKEQIEYLQKLGVRKTINKIDVTPSQLVDTIHQILGS